MIFEATDRDRLLQHFEDIPGLVVQALLLGEDRKLLTAGDPWKNPVVDWPRLTRAGLSYAGSNVGLEANLVGGSTLATQMEKYRYSPAGVTHSAADKFNQMLGASLKVYKNGRDTRDIRRRIMLDYLNTMPLAAAPGYGEIYGLGDGLLAWFGLDLDDLLEKIQDPDSTPTSKASAFKPILTLIAAVQAPSFYLRENRHALERRVSQYVKLLWQEGIIDGRFAVELLKISASSLERSTEQSSSPCLQKKASDAVRRYLLQALRLDSIYDLDRLHLEVKSTIDTDLQDEVVELFDHLKDPHFLESNGLQQKGLLLKGDPGKVVYSFLLFERTEGGNLLRVQADSLGQPFDLNEGMKLELGSTAKLRTLAHYLQIMYFLYQALSPLDEDSLVHALFPGSDALTRWAVETLRRERDLDLEDFLEKSLERRYSADPYERFFTGAGVHTFKNFDVGDNRRVLSLREAFHRSVNLVFIRLMRDLVLFHQSRLDYDARAVLEQQDHPERRRLLERAADHETAQILAHAFRTYQGSTASQMLSRLLEKRSQSTKHLALLYLAWNPEAGPKELGRWLESHSGPLHEEQVDRLFEAYSSKHWGLLDYAYLLRQRPVDVWCAGQLVREPDISWPELLARSREVRRLSAHWLFESRHRRAQELRLRAQIERDAFARMADFWKELGFPFAELTPSYAAAIGSSGDRPWALAQLAGVVLNDGALLPVIRAEELKFAPGTPYHTALEASRSSGKRLMPSTVARVLRKELIGVVEKGTGRRVAGIFTSRDGTAVKAGGKTGSGDNRFNRTATFVFFVEEKYFGVVTAFVSGKKAKDYDFTSALPAQILKLLAPAINTRLHPQLTPT